MSVPHSMCSYISIDIFQEYQNCWFGRELPGRPCQNGVYQKYEFKSLPFVETSRDFRNVSSIRDFESKGEEIYSLLNLQNSLQPDFTEENLFLKDVSGGLSFYFSPETGVYANKDRWLVVAKSLPEFLTRLQIENNIWMNQFGPEMIKTPLTPGEVEYMNEIFFMNSGDTSCVIL